VFEDLIDKATKKAMDNVAEAQEPFLKLLEKVLDELVAIRKALIAQARPKR
jgi:hypothetical protein